MRSWIRRTAVASFVLAVSLASPAATHNIPRTSLNLGDSTADLVYTPVSPCRIIDTRLAGGAVGTSPPRSFHVKGTAGFDTQGGTTGGCGIPVDATAVLINFVAVNPQGVGNLKGSAYPNPIPTTGSILNYQALNPVLNVANGIAFPVCNPLVSTCTFDLSLQANGNATDVVADVLGFFKRFAKEQIVSSLTAGAGLTGGGVGDVAIGVTPGGIGAAQINTTEVQARVSAPCAAGTAMTSIGADGTVTCMSVLPPTVYLEQGTYSVTVPAGATSLIVEAWGGGGGGGAGASLGATNYSGGGGGGGGYINARVAVTPGTALNVTVGTAGTVSGGNASAGGATTIGTLVTANGGGPGFAAGSFSGDGTGGQGGTVSTTGVVIKSSNGANGGGGFAGLSGLDVLFGKFIGGVHASGGSGGSGAGSSGANGQPGLAILTFSQ